jgi:predicted kinase
MSKVLILKGLPASGKTTFARKVLAGDIHDMGGTWKRVNKDDLRAMLDNSYWSKENEKFVLMIRDFVLDMALMQGFNVIIDDTNLNPKHEAEIRKQVETFNNSLLPKHPEAIVEVKFFDTPVEECIKRDLTRPVLVGKDVIMQMYNQYLKVPELITEAVKQLPILSGKPVAIMCDIDGTLAHMKNRGPFEWSKVGQDEVDGVVANMLRIYRDKGYLIILLSGRDGVCYVETINWLSDNHIKFDALFMREEGDNRKDSIIKKELFDAKIRKFYNIAFVLDDRNQVVNMWRNELGLKTLQVADGDF